MNSGTLEQILLTVTKIAINAGKSILEIYNNNFNVTYKSDFSPLTDADQLANDYIVRNLKTQFEFPIISEESRYSTYNMRKDWEYFWLVDPLDGTKEFINKNGEFTVNIALIHNNSPILGVVYAPAKNVLYFSNSILGSFVNYSPHKISYEMINDHTKFMQFLYNTSACLSIKQQELSEIKIITSRSHLSRETTNYINLIKQRFPNKIIQVTYAGSSLKICLIAEGIVHVYPRLAPTMEWDTAAAHCILKMAGGNIYSHQTKKELLYNKEELRNEWFIAK